jgi:L-ascorbate metabolism protein UlaG (beta-lactamase superfamily)
MRVILFQAVTMAGMRRLARNAILAGTVVLCFLALLFWRMWQISGTVEDIGWAYAAVAGDPGEQVTATWLGTTTILFDDGETQVLIDGAFTRVGPIETLLLRPVRSDAATINYAMSTYGMSRVAAIVPVHSHHDHAIDVGHVANRSNAVVLGSESTAMIARGADVPVDQYQVLASGETRQFGDFTIKLIANVHAPIGPDDAEIFPGVIEAPLRQPARISAYRTGVAWSVLLSHPRGTTLVQGSAGFREGLLRDEKADVVMASIAGLSGLGEPYTRKFWAETIAATGAPRVIAIHHDDFTAPFGEVRLLPDMFDKVLVTAAWIDAIIAEGDGATTVELPPFGEPIILY